MTSNIDYHIGQVFYVVFAKQTLVLPFRIVEKTTKQTLQGEETIYKAECPRFENQVFTLKDIEAKGKIFLTIDDVRVFMMERATAAVIQLVDYANEMSNKWYGEVEQFVKSNAPSSQQNNENNSSYDTVVLSDGTVAKIRKVPKQE